MKKNEKELDFSLLFEYLFIYSSFSRDFPLKLKKVGKFRNYHLNNQKRRKKCADIGKKEKKEKKKEEKNEEKIVKKRKKSRRTLHFFLFFFQISTSF